MPVRTVPRLCLTSIFLLCLCCSDRAIPGGDAGKPGSDSGPVDGAIVKDFPDRREWGIPSEMGMPPDMSKLSCKALATEYDKNLQHAKVCNPVLSVLQCTLKHNNHLPCPCPTYINPANKKYITDMASLLLEWKAKSCAMGWPCPGMPCANPKYGYCEPTPPGSKVPGLCKDAFK